MAIGALTRNFAVAVACVLILATPGWLAKARPQLHSGRPYAEWVREALQSQRISTNALDVVCSELKGKAVPYIIREIRARTGSTVYRDLYGLQFRIGLPGRLWLLPEPRQSNGVIGRAARVLCEMGEPAQPAIPVLVRALETADLHVWEAQEVMHCLIWMGPVASGALPRLRKMALSRDLFAVEAGLAIHQIDGTTEALCEALITEFAEGEGYVSQALGWFEKDEQVNLVVAQALQAAVAQTNCPSSRRSALIGLLTESGGTNAPSRTIIELLTDSEKDWRAPSL
jgi:hypothetical protein